MHILAKKLLDLKALVAAWFLAGCALQVNSPEPLPLRITTTSTTLQASLAIRDELHPLHFRVPRGQHVTLALADGRILALGGSKGGASAASLSSTELYDPAVGSWSLGPTAPRERSIHRAVLLSDGRVLTVGGAVGFLWGSLNTADLFDPSGNSGAGAWSSPPNMSVARSAHVLVSLGGGQALVAGGTTGGAFPSPHASAEIFDGTLNGGAGAWVPTAPMSVPRLDFAAVLLPGGKVLAVGGANSVLLNSAEIFHAGSWTATGSLAVGRRNHQLALLPGGKVMVAGGSDGAFTTFASVEIFDPAANLGIGAWSPGPSMNEARQNFTLTRLADGRLLATGGQIGVGDAKRSAEIFDPGANGGVGAWTLVPDMIGPGRCAHMATLMADESVLVSGACGSGVRTATEIFRPTPSGGTWFDGPAVVEGRHDQRFARLHDGRILSVGGASSGSMVSDLKRAEIFDPAANAGGGAWISAPSLPSVVNFLSLVTLDSGKVLALGANMPVVNLAWEFDPAASGGVGAWTAVGVPITARLMPTLTVLEDGRVLAFGGNDEDYEPLASVEFYNPATRLWTAGTSAHVGRISNSATLLEDGRVLVVGGGVSGGSGTDAVEIFNPLGNGGLGTWTLAPSLVEARSGAPAVRLADGRVMVIGGASGNGSPDRSSVEIFDPRVSGGIGAWTTAPAYPYVVGQQTANLLPDGRVLVTGGQTGGLANSLDLKIFDPAASGGTGAWSSGPNMVLARARHAAMVLEDGRVLVEGVSASLRDRPSIISFYESATLGLDGAGGYTYAFLNGEGSLAHVPGSHTITFTPWHAGVVTIQVTDRTGRTGTVSITVNGY